MEAVPHSANVYFIGIPERLAQLARDRLGEPRRRPPAPSSATRHCSSSTEMGYLPRDQVATSFLFQLVSQRSTKGSVIVTSNKSDAEWGSVFGDDVAAAAVLDRCITRPPSPARAIGSRTRKRAGVFTMPTPKPAV